MGAAAHAFRVDTVTLHRNHIAAVFAEMERRNHGAATCTAFSEQSFERADTFIRVACEHAAGAVPNITPPWVATTARSEIVMAEDQARALEVLERLADGDRFIVDDERMARALQHWVDQGCAGRDEDGYFLTPAGRTHVEKVFG